MQYEYKHLACGGTFDFLHKGHIGFLNYSFKKAAFVSIGLTSDKFAKSMGKVNVRPQGLRLNELDDFLKKNHYQGRSKVILLDDIFGSTVGDKSIEGIVVTKFSKTGAGLINVRRKKIGMPPLRVLRFPIVRADDGSPISSGRIRAGQIDRNGNNYFLRIGQMDYSLPSKLRGLLARAHGRLFGTIDDLLSKKIVEADSIIAVGDETTLNFLKKGVVPKLSIVDLKVGRKKIFDSIYDLGFSKGQSFATIENPPSTINKALTGAVNNYFHDGDSHSFVINILGEEDLAVLPATILAPLGYCVLYGQPGQGVILVNVTEEKKAEFLQILSRLDQF